MKRLAILLIAGLFCPTALLFASDFTAPVVSVLDGDTFDVLHTLG